MTPEKLAALRRLHEAATPGEWIVKKGIVLGGQHEGSPFPLIQEGWYNSKKQADAALIAAACNALPELLDEIERLSRQWTCFHCGFQTGDRNEAAAHFGEMGEEEPLCLTWKDLDEHGKASELQNALGQLAEANVEIERLRLALSQIAYLKVPVKKIAREALGK